ncbi:VOC family protein [Haladaptatus sp. CMSO5]|uniref:VOC family protein n=1 Tax=Haladaptatus sp. CMSO5 TaxID=3120514 RepID=UPI002FCE26CE
MTKNLAQVFLQVADVSQSVAFYETGLGLTVTHRGEQNATFETGSCELMVQKQFDAQTLDGFGLVPPEEPKGSGAIIVIEVEEVEEAYEGLDAVDADLRCEPQVVPWGREMFIVADPDGYILEISRPAPE